MKRNYIGLATSLHDPAIAIVNSAGKVVFAEATERYLQDKRAWCAAPDGLIRIKELIKTYCEPNCELVIATGWRPDYSKKLNRQTSKWLKPFMVSRIGIDMYNFLRFIVAYKCGSGLSLEQMYSVVNPNCKIIRRYYDHHLAHIATAAYSSAFKRATCVVIDGFGESGSVSCFEFDNMKLRQLKIKPSRNSLGVFYEIVCDLCGFDSAKGEAWKVMGLAPYGKLNQDYYSLLKQMISVDDCTLTGPKDKRKEEIIRDIEKITAHCTKPLEYADLAYTGQYIFTEIMNALLNNLSKKLPNDNLVLAGGCMLNSAYVGKIEENTPFKNSFLFSAPSDDGNAVGTALLAFYEDHPNLKNDTKKRSPYLGSTLNNTKLDYMEKFGGLTSVDFNKRDDDLYSFLAKKLANGKIIAWAKGRAEFGPRALGNRSILADPRHPDIKQRINASIKFREEFRPFAPAILDELGADYFENYKDTPYMERALPFKETMKGKVPGVVHVDGTGRLQSVTKERNLEFYNLIYAFYQETGVPILLNTSFNVMGKPIIHTVEDALSVFFTSGIDILVINGRAYEKSALTNNTQASYQHDKTSQNATA